MLKVIALNLESSQFDVFFSRKLACCIKNTMFGNSIANVPFSIVLEGDARKFYLFRHYALSRASHSVRSADTGVKQINTNFHFN